MRCNLKELNISECTFSYSGAFKLFNALKDYKELKTLILDRNYFAAKDNMKMTALKEVLYRTKIEKLSINDCHLGEEGGKAVGEALQEYRFCILQTISARHNNFKDEVAKAFAIGMKVSSKLEKLDLSCNNIGDAGGELITEALQSNSSLVSLNLSRNNLRVTSAALFVEAVEMNPNILHLKLNDNLITKDFISAIDGHLRKNKTNHELNTA